MSKNVHDMYCLGHSPGYAWGVRMQYVNKNVEYHDAQYAKCTICIKCNLICKIIGEKKHVDDYIICKICLYSHVLALLNKLNSQYVEKICKIIC